MNGPGPLRRPGAFAADSEHTIIRPSLSHAATGTAASMTPSGLVIRAHTMSLSSEGLSTTESQRLDKLWAEHFQARGQSLAWRSGNPLVDAASPMLHFILLLREQVLEPSGVNHFLSLKIRSIEDTCLQLQCDRIEVEAARYVLCTVMDELLGDCPWAAHGAWARHSLLLTHFRETWGGEKVFQLLERFRRDPRRYINSLELIALCMSLGFKGKFHVQAGGALAHETLRKQLHQEIAAIRGAAPRALSDQVNSKAHAPAVALRHLPWWMLPMLSLALMACVYVSFLFHLHGEANRTSEAIHSISLPATASLAPRSGEETLLTSLRGEFARELKQSMWSIRVQGRALVIVMGGDGMFDSAQVQLKPTAINSLDRLVEILKGQSVRLHIHGHTDNQAIRSIPFPSNWELSTARAEVVKTHLQNQGLSLPMEVQGLAASQPLDSNTSTEGRARNRRVEILIHPLESVGVR